MTQADRVHSTPPTNASAETLITLPQRVTHKLLPQLATPQRRAEKTRQRVCKLREMASAEIERLIAFMDATDGYTMDEREEDAAESGIADFEGLLEQVGSQDWTHTVMG